jgi:hypothetical protein
MAAQSDWKRVGKSECQSYTIERLQILSVFDYI